MVLLVYLDDAVLFVIKSERCEISSWRGVVVFEDGGLAGRRLAPRADKCRGIVARFGRVGIGLARAEGVVIVQVVVVVVDGLIEVDIVVHREVRRGVVERCGRFEDIELSRTLTSRIRYWLTIQLKRR